LGKLKFSTICAACHGLPGDGSGLVAKRATDLVQEYWVQPTSLHDPKVQKQPVGKIYHTITNGRGKMGPYGNVLSAKERWAIVLYVRALQLSRDAKSELLTEDEIKKLTSTPAQK
jgi:mono/diheme cytochrome c family protein